MSLGRTASALPLPPRNPQRRVVLVAVLAIALLVVVAHLPLRHSEYIQDDHLAVEQNSIVERGDLGEIYSTSYWAGARGDDRSLYRPTVILSFALERRLAGEPNALVSQLVNLLLHLAASLGLLWFLRRLGADLFVATTAALLFSVHPIHVEAVAGIVGRAEILAVLCSLLGLVALSRAGRWRNEEVDERPGCGSCRFAAWTAALLLFLALGAKEVALATVVLYVAVELLFRPSQKGPRSAWWIDRAAALAPSGLAVLVYLTLRVRALEMLVSLQQAHPSDNPLVRLDGVERAATALGLVARYIRLLFYPVGLSADYSGPVIEVEESLLALRPLVGTLVLLGCSALAVRPFLRRAAGRPARLWAVGAMLFLLPYLIIGNLLFTVGTIFAERLAYFPSAGFCLVLALLLGTAARTSGETAEDQGPRHRRLAPSPQRFSALALAALVTAFLVLTWARTLDWRNDETLFRAAVRVRPKSPRAHFIVGKLLGDRGESEAALEHLVRTTKLYPAYVAAWNERGVVHGRLGEFARGEAMFREAVRISPAHAQAHFNLAIALRRQNRAGDAERSLRRALLWDPGLDKAWAELGNLSLRQGRYQRAVRAYRRAIALGREDVRPRLLEAQRRAEAGGTPLPGALRPPGPSER